jgi:hypothetical protein
VCGSVGERGRGGTIKPLFTKPIICDDRHKKSHPQAGWEPKIAINLSITKSYDLVITVVIAIATFVEGIIRRSEGEFVEVGSERFFLLFA